MKSSQKLNLKQSTSTYKINNSPFRTPNEKNMGQKLREKIQFQKRSQICGKYQKESGYLNLTSSNRRNSLDYLRQIPFESINRGRKGCFINQNRMASSSKNKYYQFKRDQIKAQPKIKDAIKKIDILLSKLNQQKRNLKNPNLIHVQKSNKLMFKQSINTTHSQNNQFEQIQSEQNLAYQILKAKARLAVSNYYASDSNQVKSEQPFLTKDELNQLPTVKYQGAPTSCAVCLQQIKHGDEVTLIMCMHFVHPNCCQDWLSRSTKCPLCQIDIKKQLN